MVRLGSRYEVLVRLWADGLLRAVHPPYTESMEQWGLLHNNTQHKGGPELV